MHGVLKLRRMVQDDPEMSWRDRYDARGTEEVLEAPGQAPAAGVGLEQRTPGA